MFALRMAEWMSSLYEFNKIKCRKHRLNYYKSEVLIGRLVVAEHLLSRDSKPCGIIFINACIVTVSMVMYLTRIVPCVT